MPPNQTPQAVKLDERNHVEKPLLDQLHGLGWDVLDLEMKQQPGETGRENFAQVVILPVQAIKVNHAKHRNPQPQYRTAD